MQVESRIALLDIRLANQIAAGEVVERPASVVKELLENSIDAGATRIEVDIERGGARLIRITDNGHGIHKDDLNLALTRHATSKIKSSEDLANIHSLGFRGEALASIGSVSRLTLTSRQRDSELAWQAIAHGRDMQVEVLPAAASPGTRLEIADLFFNTPARQKFLRAEKTEFHHIEDVFKCHALANPGIAFILKHNHKIVKRVPATDQTSDGSKRVAAICGQAFMEHALSFNCQHELMAIHGWLGTPSFHRSESDIQYVFVNGRPVKDKTLSHAIRQAYEGMLPQGRMATFVIFIDIDPLMIDVNVHPTKHEVRFSQQRLVHDLLAKSITDALSNSEVKLESREVQAVAASVQIGEPVTAGYQSKSTVATSFSRAYSPQARSTLGVPVRPIGRAPGASSYDSEIDDRHRPQSLSSKSEADRTAIITGKASGSVIVAGDNFFISIINDLPVAIKGEQLLVDYIQCLLDEKCQSQRKSLLFPVHQTLANELLEDFCSHQFLARLGFDCVPGQNQQLEIRQIPIWLESVDSQQIFKRLPDWLTAVTLQGAENAELAQMIGAIIEQIPPHLVARLVDEMGSFNPAVDNVSWLRTLDPPLLSALFP